MKNDLYSQNLEKLQEKIKYKFHNIDLCKRALTHPSYNHSLNYQRLEFLGDGILNAIISDLLYHKYHKSDEGKMSRIHSKLVSSVTLAEIAMNINLGDLLLLDLGEESTNGRTNKRNLENAMEALIGAIYLDSSYNQTKEIVSFLWNYILQQPDFILESLDSKSHLQEWIQKKFKVLPKYRLLKQEGPLHSLLFTVECITPMLKVIGVGLSKKGAEQNAAENALQEIKNSEKNFDR